MTIKDSLAYRKGLGKEESLKYMHDLAVVASEILVEELGTNRLIENTEKIGAIFSIRLPNVGDKEKATELERIFLEKHKISLKCFEYSDAFYLRFCCQIINEEEDFRKTAKVLKSYLFC